MRIPISFQHNGKKYLGYFSEVHGAGVGIWHLMDEKNYYLGRLRQARNEWVFGAPDKVAELKELADYFGNYLTAWYQ